MFVLIRLIFIFLLFGIAYSWIKWKMTGIVKWRNHFELLRNTSILFALAIFAVLVLTRL